VNPDDPKDTPSVRQDAVAVDAASEKGTATVARDRDRKKKPQDKLALGEPKSNDEAGELLKEAKKHVAKIEWAQAEEKYLLVANSKYRKSAGYVGLAEVAFEARKTDKAIRYAKKARKSKAAMRILGHAYFQKGQYAVALDYYERVLAKDPGNVEIQRSAKKAREAVGK